MSKRVLCFLILAWSFASLAIGCSGKGGSSDTAASPGTLTVIVENGHKGKVQNAIVVLGDSDGAMITFTATDSNGEATFMNVPANATVTAAKSCVYSGSTNTRYSLAIQYDVNTPTVTMEFDGLTSCESALGTVIVKVTNLPAGTRYVDFTPDGQISSMTGSNASATISIYPDAVQSDGKVSIVAIPLDATGRALSFGALTDLTLVSGMTVTIAANQTLGTVRYQIDNIPSSAKYVSPSMWVSRKNMYSSTMAMPGWQYLASTGTSTVASVPYVPAFGDMFSLSVMLSLDQNSNGMMDAMQMMSKWYSAEPGDQVFDVSQMPVIPSNLAVTQGTTATPTLSWSGTDAAAYLQWLSMSITTAATTTYNPIDVDSLASPMRTGITFPQLPDSLAAFRPTGVIQFTVGNYQSDLFSGYADYQSKIEQYNNGTWTPPANYTMKYGMANYSSNQALAPTVNSNAAPALRVPKRHYIRVGPRQAPGILDVR